MTDEANALMERRYLLVKRGLYYAPDRQGYTGLKAKAGRYREVDALGLDGVTAIHEDEAQDFAPACWEETKLAHLNGIIETQAREIERLRAVLDNIAHESSDTWARRDACVALGIDWPEARRQP